VPAIAKLALVDLRGALGGGDGPMALAKALIISSSDQTDPFTSSQRQFGIASQVEPLENDYISSRQIKFRKRCNSCTQGK
jgi:hypothetical protein